MLRHWSVHVNGFLFQLKASQGVLSSLLLMLQWYKPKLMVKTHPKGNLAAKIRLLRNVKILLSEVGFGTPGKRCEGSGLCRIYTVTGAKRLDPHPRRVPVILLINAKGNLGIRLNKNDLSEELHRELFQGSVFMMEEQFMLPKYFARKLGVTQYMVPAGSYPLQARGNWLDIVF